MRAYEILPESQQDQNTRIVIDKRISELQNILNEFDIQVDSKGYDVTCNNIIEQLNEDNRREFYLKFLVSGNSKLMKSFSKLEKLREEIVKKVNSGI